jgi:hypothetical protein
MNCGDTALVFTFIKREIKLHVQIYGLCFINHSRPMGINCRKNVNCETRIAQSM